MVTKLDVSVGLTLLGLALLGCKKGSGSECYLNKDCKDNFVCLSAEGHPKCWDLAQAKTECTKNSECKSVGNCSVYTTGAAEELAICAPKSDEDCKQSTRCKEKGLCQYEPGKACQ